MGLENQNSQIKDFENNQISIRDLIIKIKSLIFLLKSKWKILLIIGTIGGIIGLFIDLIYKPTYKASLTFAMEEDKGGGNGGISGALGLASSFGIDLGGAGGGAFSANNLGELMKSRLIIEKVLLKPIVIKGKKTNLLEYYIEFNQLRKLWSKNPSLSNINFESNIERTKYSLQQDSILQQIHKTLIDKDNLSIMQKDKKVTILTIEVVSENELFSLLFCENLAMETSDFYIETKSKKARMNVNVLQNQVDSVRGQLNGAITGVAVSTDNVYNLNPALNIKGAPTKKKQIDIQINTAIITNLVVQLELAKINLRKETPLIQLIDKPILPLEKDKLGKLKSLLLGFFISIFITSIFLIFQRIIIKIS